MYGYKIPFGDAYAMFPCDTVYGNIEIKSYLNQDELKKAIENLKSLKMLQRKDASVYNITPHRAIDFAGAEKKKTNHYLTCIFAYDSLSADTLLEHIKNLHEDAKYLPEMIVLWEKHCILFPMNENVIALGGGADSYGSFCYKDNLSEMFISTFIWLLERIDLDINVDALVNYAFYENLKGSKS